MVLSKEADILQPITRLKNRARLIGYAAIGFMCLFYLFFFFILLNDTHIISDRIARTLSMLVDATQDVATENYEMIIEPSDVEELGQLSMGFQTMTKNLKILHNGLTDQINQANAAEKAAN